MTRAIAQLARSRWQAAVYAIFAPAFSPARKIHRCARRGSERGDEGSGTAVSGNRKYFTLNLVYAVSVIETPSRITRPAREIRGARPLRSRDETQYLRAYLSPYGTVSTLRAFLRLHPRVVVGRLVFGNLRPPLGSPSPYADQVSLLCELPMSLIHVHGYTYAHVYSDEQNWTRVSISNVDEWVECKREQDFVGCFRFSEYHY